MPDEDFVGFGVKGYRSFGSSEMQRVGPMSKIHLVVGQNNVGKSNLLHFLHDVMRQLRNGEQKSMSEFFSGAHDTPTGWDSSISPGISIGIRLTESVRSAFSLPPDGRYNRNHPSMFSVLDCAPYSPDLENDVVWFDFDFTTAYSTSSTVKLTPSRMQFESASPADLDVDYASMLNSVSSSMTSTSGGSPYENFERIVSHWAPWRFIPETVWIDAVREITRADQVPVGRSVSGMQNGRGLIEELAKLQSPDYSNFDEDSAKFNALLEFTRSVLDDERARINIPDSKETILVSTKNGLRPIEGLGTGISELIVIAAATTVVSGKLVCIEEPEVHLHPTLQRRLMQYLADSTDNRYLISTHSAAMLNAELASISHVTMPDSWSKTDMVTAPKALASTVADLGNRASDLVQSNFVVWVEGPSDRLYVAHWLRIHASDLIEGAHYSIMFYGGALLSHLTADDDEVDDFIKLARINRNLAIVIDSDKKSAEAELNATKSRVLAELVEAGGLGWVTDSYTIENYVPRAVLGSAIADLYPNEQYTMPSGKWKSPLGSTFKSKTAKPSKVSVAKYVLANSEGANWPDELREHVIELAGRIRLANDIAQPAEDGYATGR